MPPKKGKGKSALAPLFTGVRAYFVPIKFTLAQLKVLKNIITLRGGDVVDEFDATCTHVFACCTADQVASKLGVTHSTDLKKYSCQFKSVQFIHDTVKAGTALPEDSHDFPLEPPPQALPLSGDLPIKTSSPASPIVITTKRAGSADGIPPAKRRLVLGCPTDGASEPPLSSPTVLTASPPISITTPHEEDANAIFNQVDHGLSLSHGALPQAVPPSPSASESDEEFVERQKAAREAKKRMEASKSESVSPEKPKSGPEANPGPFYNRPGWQPNKEYFACQKDPVFNENKNEHITSVLEELVKAAGADGDEWRSFTFRKVITLLKAHPTEITSGAAALKIKGIGKKTAQKIQEIIDTGKLRRVENLKTDSRAVSMAELSSIWGVGPDTAQKWYARGIRSLDDVRRAVAKDPKLLNAQQTIALEFHEELKQRIPREEVADIERRVFAVVRELDPCFIAITCGSYRRGKATCGDVDILLTHPDGTSHMDVLARVVPRLHAVGLLTHDLTHSFMTPGTDKYMGIGCVPGGIHRRIDLKAFPVEEFGPAVLYFTGSDHFNRSMRLWARRKGFSLNEHALVRRYTLDTKSEEPIPGLLTEEDVFKALDLEYRAPEDRNI